MPEERVGSSASSQKAQSRNPTISPTGPANIGTAFNSHSTQPPQGRSRCPSSGKRDVRSKCGGGEIPSSTRSGASSMSTLILTSTAPSPKPVMPGSKSLSRIPASNCGWCFTSRIGIPRFIGTQSNVVHVISDCLKASPFPSRCGRRFSTATRTPSAEPGLGMQGTLTLASPARTPVPESGGSSTRFAEARHPTSPAPPMRCGRSGLVRQPTGGNQPWSRPRSR